MALMDAQPVDENAARARRRKAGIAFVIVLVGSIAWWEMRFWPEEHAAGRFFARLQAADYEGAYALWMADPDWKKHPQKYDRYPYGQFYLDWGPGGDNGVIHSYKVLDADNPPQGRGSGVIVNVQVNGRPIPVPLWVEKDDKSLSFPP